MARKTYDDPVDLIVGAEPIGAVLDRSGRWIYQYEDRLPVFRDETGRLCAFRGVLEAYKQARAARLDALRAEMIEKATKAAPIIGKRRGRRPREAAAKMLRRQRRRQREAAAVASTA
jgi:hypothetical protein